MNDYGAKAHQDLIVTRGDGFRKEKNKKKRGSYRGGEITVSWLLLVLNTLFISFYRWRAIALSSNCAICLGFGVVDYGIRSLV